MSLRKTIALAPLFAAVFATGAFASPGAEPETPGSAGPQAVAEAIHNARMHGLSTVEQPIAQAPGLVQPQSLAETAHLRKSHGVINDSADQRMLREGARF